MARPLRVLVDARAVFARERRGIGKSLLDLYRTLARQQPDWDIVMVHQRAEPNPFADVPNVRAKRIDIPGDRYDAWENLRLPLAVLSERPDVLHCPANSAPRAATVPIVATIHDLIALTVDRDDEAVRRWRRRVTRAAGVAAQIITPSEFTRGEVVARLGVAADRVTAIPWAPDVRLRRVSDPNEWQRLAAARGIPAGERYVLAFGAEDPRKNGQRIIRAWAAVPPESRRGVRLLLSGFQPEVVATARLMAAADCPDGTCVIAGFAAESEMAGLMSGALCLCYPSLGEGFGLPVLDAFACGTPVITSTVTSLPEVAGDAALLVDPTDEAAITHALERLVSSEAERARLVAAGTARVAQFSWEHCAQASGAVLERAIGIHAVQM